MRFTPIKHSDALNCAELLSENFLLEAYYQRFATNTFQMWEHEHWIKTKSLFYKHLAHFIFCNILYLYIIMYMGFSVGLSKYEFRKKREREGEWERVKASESDERVKREEKDARGRKHIVNCERIGDSNQHLHAANGI